jgi:aspartyl-tRNA(Asn)/glutamyl-tRNA(Gln) amidotransferase subunit B
MSRSTGAPEILIGLEVHLQVNSGTKLFSGEKWQEENAPNTLVSAVSLGLPGAIPTINPEVVTKGLILACRVGGAIACDLAFDRKHYTYPDLPKGYQITQKYTPLSVGGYFPYLHDNLLKVAAIRQVHLEEDAGKTITQEGTLYLDYNRAGAPLIELVSEPCFHSVDEAIAFLQQLQMWVRQADISSARMENGGMRCDVNVSVGKYLTRSEIKNLNSFSEIRKAVGELVVELSANSHLQAGYTFRYDTITKRLLAMRTKEQPRKYRFLPEFDLPAMPVRYFCSEQIYDHSNLPFPAEKVLDFKENYQMSTEEAWFFVHHHWADDILRQLTSVELLAEAVKVICGPLAALWKDLKKTPKLPGKWVDELQVLVKMVKDTKLSKDIAYNRVLPLLVKGKVLNVSEFAKQEGWVLNNKKGELSLLINKVLNEHPKERERLFAGERRLIGFFIGVVREQSGQSANPKLVSEILQDKLKGI